MTQETSQSSPVVADEQKAIAAVLAHKIVSLGYSAEFVPPIVTGPVVSVYRFQPYGSTRVSHIEGMAEDFAVALGAEHIFTKRLPGETAVGIFVPNKERKFVLWRDVITAIKPGEQNIPLLLGIDHLGKIVVEDLSVFPHLLIAGSTGSGKSTLLHSLVAGIVYSVSSSEVKFVLSDTKGVEFGHFIGIPHLLFDEPATSVYQTLEQFDWCIEEMQNRLRRFARGQVHNILEWNSKRTKAYSDENPNQSEARLPYIVVVIDELADLLGDSSRPNEKRGPTIGKLATEKIGKLAQKARASGIHLIASTQRPSVKLLEGDIRANFLARLSFRLPDGSSSRTVLATEGAEHLLSRGDMLFINPNKPGMRRIHAPIASPEDIVAAVEYASRRPL
jgi:S-DNA-T family DNA segregation ATPase FtsK/SpoIIIE